jgi:hypothetical protein
MDGQQIFRISVAIVALLMLVGMIVCLLYFWVKHNSLFLIGVVVCFMAFVQASVFAIFFRDTNTNKRNIATTNNAAV